MNSSTSFLNKVEIGFAESGLTCRDFFGPNMIIGFGVSGGADSLSLLQSAILLREKFYGEEGAKFVVVSVNHNIRPKEEGLADALFVKEFCSKNKKIDFVLVDFESGQVEAASKNRGRGLEEAARFLRYQSFTSVAKERGCNFFCLAHNQNDQLETLLLRFLQGGGDGIAQGIPAVRDFFIRPLLQISRHEIEEFLTFHQLDYREDKTNKENQYLRNRCRNLLIPLLDKEFPGWNKSILQGAKKGQDDKDYIASTLPDDFWKHQDEEGICASWNSFLLLHPALRRRILYKGLNELGVEERIPFYLFESLVYGRNKMGKGRIFSIYGVEVYSEKDAISIRKIKKQCEQAGFSLLIDRAGTYSIFGKIFLVEEKILPGTLRSERKLCLMGNEFTLPFLIRNAQNGDKTIFQGRIRSVQDVLSKKNYGKENQYLIVEEFENPLVTLVPLTSYLF